MNQHRVNSLVQSMLQINKLLPGDQADIPRPFHNLEEQKFQTKKDERTKERKKRKKQKKVDRDSDEEK